MNFEEALRAELGTIPELANKVYPLNATEGVKTPFVVYVSSEGVPDLTLDGYVASKEVDCEINLLHNTYSDMKDLTKQVITKILSFRGRVISIDGPFIKDIEFDKPAEFYEKEVFLYRSVIDFKFKM